VNGQPAGNLAANALFDAGALPTWLGGSGNTGQPARTATPLGGDGLQVSSLVDERSLPMWLRQEPEQAPAQAPMPGSVSRWLSAPVTEETMPPFLHQVYDAAQVARAETPAGAPGYWGAAAPTPAPPLPGAVPSAQLLDDSALPQWLRAQADGRVAGQPPGATSAGWSGFGGASAIEAPLRQPAANGPAGSFAASDLIEPGAVPAWVQQGAPPPQPTFSSTEGWTDHTPTVSPPAGTGTHQGMQMNPGWNAAAMSAPSESASLPTWLRTSGASDGPDATGEWTAVHAGVRRTRDSVIPPSELPPWLRDGAAGQPAAADQRAAAYAAPAPRPDSTDQQWAELQRGWDGDENDHYLDRFGVEEPGADRPFSMEYDQQQQAAGGADADHTGHQRVSAPDRGKGKRKRFGR
jgi:hypothetical protein